jgi:membrane-associated PAP2 superfamily phosphatase
MVVGTRDLLSLHVHDGLDQELADLAENPVQCGFAAHEDVAVDLDHSLCAHRRLKCLCRLLALAANLASFHFCRSWSCV